MDLSALMVKGIIYPHGEYLLGHPVPVLDEGSFYRIDGSHIFDKWKIEKISWEDEIVTVVMKNQTVKLILG